jgi:hypothetical protein
MRWRGDAEVTIGLGFGATLGATVLVFQTLAGQTGRVFPLPVSIGPTASPSTISRRDLRPTWARGRQPCRSGSSSSLPHHPGCNRPNGNSEKLLC